VHYQQGLIKTFHTLAIEWKVEFEGINNESKALNN
jgi:hypothetical protein